MFKDGVPEMLSVYQEKVGMYARALFTIICFDYEVLCNEQGLTPQ